NFLGRRLPGSCRPASIAFTKSDLTHLGVLASLATTVFVGCSESSPTSIDAGPIDVGSVLDAGPAPADAGPMPSRTVEVRATAEGWALFREGEPYAIRGAGFGGGAAQMDLLRAAGANTLRTWSTVNAQEILDLAHARGMTVLMGIWLGQVQQGFDYTDNDAVAAQLARARAQVQQYRNHPALLAWGVGNEVEIGAESLPEMWAAIEAVAAMVKQVDPEHPTVVVTAEIGVGIDRRLREQVPSADIWGINTYEGAASLVDRLEARGWEGPYLLAEYGPVGQWETNTTSWGAPVEPLPADKAAGYTIAHEQVLDKDPRCLGGYAFFWGQPDPLDTWFALNTPMGGLMETAERLRSYWGGTPARNLPPELQSFAFGAEGARVLPGAPLEATLTATDADELSYTWVVHLRDPAAPGAVGAVTSCLPASERTFAFSAPTKPGDYRVLGVATDPSGNATLASGRFLVEGMATEAVDLPMRVDDHFVAAGWMGDSAEDGTTRRDCARSVDYCSAVCHTWTLQRRGQGWGGVIWHSPINNWDASQPGVRLVSRPIAVTFTAWGEMGGETVSFFAGNRDAGEAYAELDLTLTATPRTYRMALTSGSKEDITTGFGWVSTSPDAPGMTFHVADIQWVTE
ncbi:MAG: glycoside hydrolase family 2 TIM barrel-domain containing protein, partial [Myxococcota bacterium]